MTDMVRDGSKHMLQRAPSFLVGQRVSLRSLELTDLDALWVWFADREVVQYSLSMWLLPYSRHETQLWLEKTMREKQTLTLGVVEQTTGALIGFAGISGISQINRSGEYFICIGDKRWWSQGCGTETTRLIVSYGFATLNLHRIALTVSALNHGGVKAYERAGFTTEGILRDASYRNGAYHDKIVMSILRHEWEATDEATTTQD
jgi:RimJ/RimL family protein N-acetyltransferase